MGFLGSLNGARRRALALMALLAVAAIGAGAAGQADAGDAGQLGTSWGVQGTTAGKLSTPNMIAAEEGGSVFIGDRPQGVETSPFRLQKFSATGTAEGTVDIPTPNAEVFKAIVVDSTAHLVYLLQEVPGGDPETGQAMAEEVLIYSTTPNPTTHLLEPPSTGPTSFALPTDAAHVIDNPTDMVLDTHDHELEIAGENREGQFALQRIGTAAGATGPHYAETAETFGLNELVRPHPSVGALTVGPDGTSYVVWYSAESEANTAVTLAENLAGSPTKLTGFATASEEIQVHRIRNGSRDGSGAQVAMSPDGSTLYFKTSLATDEEHGGNIVVTAYSLADGKAFAVYGGKNVEGHCTIQNAQAALAPVGETLFALDQGNGEAVSPFGVKVSRFGQGGSECPAPSAGDAIKIGPTTVTEVHSGRPVTLDASSSELGEWGEKIESVTWKVEGPETLNQTVTSTDPHPLTLQHTFTAQGVYTVQMSIKVKAKPTGQPVPPLKARAKSLTVTAPATVAAPTVTQLSPTHGPAAGGTTVTIKGTELGEATEVHFGATAAPDLVQVSGTEVTAVAPAGTTGSKVHVTVTTNAGGQSASVPADEYTYETPTQQLSVTKAGTGSGSVVSTPAGINCGATCSFAFEQGKEVALTATAAAGSTFAGWGGPCSGTGSCRVSMSAAKSVTATFDAATGEVKPPITTPPSPAPPAPAPPVPAPPKPKTPAEMLKEKRLAALKKCQKLKGKAKSACVKKANAIGKPKKPAKKHASRQGS